MDLEAFKARLRALVDAYGDEFGRLPDWSSLNGKGFGPGFPWLDGIMVYAMVRDLKPARRLWRRVRWAAPLATAAAVILAMVFLPGAPTRLVPEPTIATADYVDHFTTSPTQELDLRVDLLAEELADYHVRLALNGSWEFETAVAGVEEEMDDLLLGDEADAAPMLDTWEEPL